MKRRRIPSFTKKTEKPDFYRMFNTRSESICEKASFRRLAPKSLCLVAVEGRETSHLQYHNNNFIISFRVAAWMPVILGDEESTDTWLYCSSSSKFDSLLKPYEDPDLVWYPVTRAMYKVPFDGPECICEVRQFHFFSYVHDAYVLKLWRGT
ncbi:uncharacterized protein [Malus domestica]|uniref:uncharacterized protein n=1 Tax=Malus domestica TaxID=3750 RepID=UPI003975331C